MIFMEIKHLRSFQFNNRLAKSVPVITAQALTGPAILEIEAANSVAISIPVLPVATVCAGKAGAHFHHTPRFYFRCATLTPFASMV